MSRRQPPSIPNHVPHVFHHIIRAAYLECPPGHAEALADLAVLASQKVPARGIFEPGERDEPEWYLAIEKVAKAHLEFSEARAAWRAAIKRAQLGNDLRDDLDAAALDVQAASDTAHFYTGLAFGITFLAVQHDV